MDTSAPVLILAPMRGITTMHYRQAFVRHFQGLELEMAPFIPTVHTARINPRLLKDILPENSSGLPLIPQLIGNNADDFVHMATALHDLGYNEVNLNMGCPHKPIRKKRRGSGLLPYPDTVDMLIDQICDRSPVKVSVKVRLGVTEKTELLHLAPVLNKYPLSEVIIHARTAEQMYEGTVDLDAFSEACDALTLPVCYNGDIDSLTMYKTVRNRFPKIRRFMLGRGLLANPFLCEAIKSAGTPSADQQGRPSAGPGAPAQQSHVGRIVGFHNDLLERYETVLYGDPPVLGKMKEFWTYQQRHLSTGRDMFKKLKKTKTLYSYKAIVAEFTSDATWTA